MAPIPCSSSGSGGRTRTCDPVVNSHLLCQLSYAGIYSIFTRLNYKSLAHQSQGEKSGLAWRSWAIRSPSKSEIPRC